MTCSPSPSVGSPFDEGYPAAVKEANEVQAAAKSLRLDLRGIKSANRTISRQRLRLSSRSEPDDHIPIVQNAL